MSVIVTETGLAYLVDKLEKINKRASKMKLPELQLTYTAVAPLLEDDGTCYLRYEADIRGEAPKMGPYILVAIKEHIAGSDYAEFIRGVPSTCLPDTAYIPNWFQTSGMVCEHCHSVRNRNEVFLLLNTNDEVTGAKESAYTQVGRTCLKDFLGVDVTSWLQHAEWLLDIEEMYTMAGIYSQPDKSADKRYFPLDTIFQYVYTEATRHGFVSKKRASEDEALTASIEIALRNFYDDMGVTRKMHWGEQRVQGAPPSDEEIAAATALLQWFQTEILPVPEKHYFGDDIMWYNLECMFNNNMLPVKMTGLVVIPYICWMKQKADLAREAERGISVWVGTVGDKIKAVATVVYKQTIESMYGPVVLHKFVTENKEVLCWFQSSGSTLQLEEGDTLTLTGTVKEHKEYRGQKETVIKGVKKQ